MRAWPCGTVGSLKPITSMPRSHKRSALRVASAASPSSTGTIGCSPGLSVKPAFPRPARSVLVLACSRSRSSLLPATSSRAFRAALTTGGDSEFKNGYAT